MRLAIAAERGSTRSQRSSTPYGGIACGIAALVYPTAIGEPSPTDKKEVVTPVSPASARRWLWNISGLDGVELALVSGRRFRIGTDEPKQLAAAIQGALRHESR